MNAIVYHQPEPASLDDLMNDIKEKVEMFTTIFPDASLLPEALLLGVSSTLDDLIGDDLGDAS